MSDRLDPVVETAMLGNALEGLCVGLVTMSAAGRVLWMNRVAQKTLGLDRDEARGELLSKLLRDPQLGDLWRQAMETEQTLLADVQLHWPRPAELKCNATTSLDPSGEITGRALLFCDVTADRAVQIKLSREATQRMLDITSHWNESAEAQEGLTAQEVRILKLLGQGLANPQIATELHISPSTVRSHLKHIYTKLSIRSRSEAISYALRNGIA